MSTFYFICGKKRLISFLLCSLMLLVLINYLVTSETTHNVSALTNSERVLYLESLGLKCIDYTPQIKDVYITETFGDVLKKYNKIQLSVGFNLEDYKGKTVIQYTYSVLDGEISRYAHLLVYDDKIIGGDISDTEFGGSMKPLKKG